MNALSDYLRLPTGFVGYFDGERWSVAADGIRFANGIAGSPAGDRLYVASMLGGAIKRYRLDPRSHALASEDELPVDGSPDNLTVSPEGELLVAVHRKILDLARQRDDRAFRAPSRVQRVTPGRPLRRETLYADDGRALSAASVAVKVGPTIFIGSVYDDHLLACGPEQAL